MQVLGYRWLGRFDLVFLWGWVICVVGFNLWIWCGVLGRSGVASGWLVVSLVALWVLVAIPSARFETCRASV